MSEQNYAQEVYTLIADYLPSDWETVVFYAECDEGSYINEFYAKAAGGAFKKCYDLDIDEDDLDELFEKTSEIVESDRNALLGSEKWSNTTMVVQSDGSVTIDYDYTDLESCAYEHKENWTKRYLAN